MKRNDDDDGTRHWTFSEMDKFNLSIGMLFGLMHGMDLDVFNFYHRIDIEKYRP